MSTTGRTRLVMNGRPRNAVWLMRRQGCTHTKRQTLHPGPLESLEELSTIVIIWQVGNSCRTLETLTGIVVIGHLCTAWHGVRNDNTLGAREATATNRAC